jgi:hypothetical protein
VGSCGHVSSRQAINVTSSRDLNADRAYPLLRAPGWSNWMPEPILGQGRKRNGHTCGEIWPAHVYRIEGRRRRGLLPGLVLFRLVAPPLLPRVVGHIRYGVCGSLAIYC